MREILQAEGWSGLRAARAPAGPRACAVEQLATLGRWELHGALRGEPECEDLLAGVPEIGPELSRRIHEQLGIETLAELEAAADEGRLARVPGMGPKRLLSATGSPALAGGDSNALREPWHAMQPGDGDPQPIAELLDIDRQYRQLAEADRLPRIAPLHFNPAGLAWLPVMHTQCGNRHYTALCGNTTRVPQLGTIEDQVIVYRDDDAGYGRWTVSTADFSHPGGRRVVRGRESECSAWYQERDARRNSNHHAFQTS